MKNTKNILLTVLSLVIIAALGFGLLSAVNSFTAPIIEAKEAGAAAEFLLKAIPDGSGFDLLYSAETGEGELENVPASVREVYAETSGLGYIVTLTTTEGYTHDPMDITVAIDTDGRIIYSNIDVFPDSKPVGDEYPLTYLGQDSTLADVSLVAGVTFSSSAFKNAVQDAFSVLIDNGKFEAGVKDDSQLLAELVTVVCPGLANASGIAQYEEFEGDGSGMITKTFKGLNEGCCAFIVNDGASLLAVCSASGGMQAYNAQGEAVSLSAAAADEVKAAAAACLGDFEAADLKGLQKLVESDDAQFEAVALEGVFNSVTSAYTVLDGETACYGFIARPYGYSNGPMEYFFLLDENGAIINMNCAEFILGAEYFNAYELDKASYREGFAGVTADSFTGDEAIVTGATFTTEATRTATQDVFAAFEALKGGM